MLTLYPEETEEQPQPEVKTPEQVRREFDEAIVLNCLLRFPRCTDAELHRQLEKEHPGRFKGPVAVQGLLLGLLRIGKVIDSEKLRRCKVSNLMDVEYRVWHGKS